MSASFTLHRPQGELTTLWETGVIQMGFLVQRLTFIFNITDNSSCFVYKYLNSEYIYAEKYRNAQYFPHTFLLSVRGS